MIKAFLCAGVLSEDEAIRDTKMGAPQGGISSPLLANIALSVLDDHFAEAWRRDMATRAQFDVALSKVGDGVAEAEYRARSICRAGCDSD